MGTITATSVGDNSIQITATGTNNLSSAMMTVFENAITGVSPVRTTGWEIYDEFQSGVVFTQVFRALNKDGITYKYFIARWDTMRFEINTTTCELWDSVNHLPTNEAWTFFDCAPITYRNSACDIIISVNPRWCAITSFINNESGVWAGVFEMEREDVADTAANGYPCWGWVSSTLWMLGASSMSAKPLNTADHTLICMPRTRSGATGVNAAKGFAGDYGMAQCPNWLATTGPGLPYYTGNQVNKFLSNAWDTTKRLVMPIKPIFDYTQTYPTNYGTIYGLKVLGPAGNTMNKIKINADADGNYSPTGDLKDHWLMNTHHTAESNHSTWFGNTAWTVTNINIAEQPQYMVSTGDSYYVVTATKLKKVNALLNTYVDLRTDTLYDLKYDGERYIYVGTSTGLLRVDTVDDSMTLLALAGGVQTMSITSQHIVCAPYTVSATPIISRVKRDTFMVDAVNGSVTLATWTEAVRIVDAVTVGDDAVLMVANVATAGNFKVVRIPKTGTGMMYNQLYAAGSANVGFLVLDSNEALLYQMVTSSSTFQTQFNTDTLQIIGTTQSVGTLIALNSVVKASCNKINGIVQAYPRANAATCIPANVTIGKTVTAFLAAPVMNVNFSGYCNDGLPTNTFLYWDGCRLIGNTSAGLKVYGNINSQFCSNLASIGQVAIPA